MYWASWGIAADGTGPPWLPLDRLAALDGEGRRKAASDRNAVDFRRGFVFEGESDLLDVLCGGEQALAGNGEAASEADVAVAVELGVEGTFDGLQSRRL